MTSITCTINVKKYLSVRNVRRSMQGDSQEKPKARKWPRLWPLFIAAAIALPVYASGGQLPDYDRRLDRAASQGDTSTLKVLLWLGAGSEERRTGVLLTAASHGQTEAVKILLDDGVDDWFAKDTALIWAANEGHAETVALLLDRGADIHAADEQALYWAAANGHAAVVRLLLERGADAFAGDGQALEAAVAGGHEDAAEALRNHMARLRAPGNPEVLPGPRKGLLNQPS